MLLAESLKHHATRSPQPATTSPVLALKTWAHTLVGARIFAKKSPSFQQMTGTSSNVFVQRYRPSTMSSAFRYWSNVPLSQLSRSVPLMWKCLEYFCKELKGTRPGSSIHTQNQKWPSKDRLCSLRNLSRCLFFPGLPCKWPLVTSQHQQVKHMCLYLCIPNQSPLAAAQWGSSVYHWVQD